MEQDIFLHYWYIERYDENTLMAHGVVTGHPKLTDTMNIHTSAVAGVEIDRSKEEAVITTRNTVYRCPLAYCKFSKQDEYPDIIPDYKALKEKYEGKLTYPEIEQGKVLLVLSDHDEYYFHSLCVRDENGSVMKFSAHPHVGMVQDSFLISADHSRIDIRYFPHPQNIEFYEDETNGMPLYAENIGTSVIYIKRYDMTFKLYPGERKELSAENASDNAPPLPDGDLYPAVML